MTDKDCLEQLIKSLNLKCVKIDMSKNKYLNNLEYFFEERNSYTTYYLGPGSGYSFFMVTFMFDKNGKIIEHSVHE